MPQLELIEAIEKRLWKSADNLRANSNFASNEYFLPVMGLIFLRHAYSRYLMVKDEIEKTLPKRGGKNRALTKEDFSQKSAIYLRPEAQYDYLVSLPDNSDRAGAIIAAMESIEEDYDLEGVLPKEEYRALENDVLKQTLQILNPDELKQASGDVFGRIYEYFLTQFADLKAHDNGEFFTPVSLVSLIANIIEPKEGIVLDPACGSGGMFVQSAHFVERLNQSPTEHLTFKGMEKNATTIRLAKMNLTVHGLEGDIMKAITYYQDPHELFQKADYVMANPPFNVDEVDADKVRNDPRLPFGLPGVNNQDKVSNGNYLWISYFYSYLNDHGRAGFVMSSQASSAGRDEAKVRQKLVETGAVEVMVSIRSNFFYTRTVPCELWFLNRAKPEEMKDSVLMIDARNIFRKVTRKIYDFSHEQEQNILTIVWLYRGETERYLGLVSRYCETMLKEAESSVNSGDENLLNQFCQKMTLFLDSARPYIIRLSGDHAAKEIFSELEGEVTQVSEEITGFAKSTSHELNLWEKQDTSNGGLKIAVDRLSSLADSSHALVTQVDLISKLVNRLIETCEKDGQAKESDLWSGRDMNRILKDAEGIREELVFDLKLVRYFWKQAHWLVERFPDGTYRDVEGLVKCVSRSEIEANDWSLTPGRYVGVAPEEVDEEFDFEEALRDIHIELEGLNVEAAELAGIIQKNFKELGI
ncbi:type I restriction-modification system subunit M [Methanospirillum sp. J.3.6.1-F.2.7.3]|uniref:site-specific DNA-methyltransferase (adenine-specific) n=1 Tax=Methanospirillum purgamenti TaxID=2834276 RepID=A0A8E7B1P7_9EURY|nr:MULTISPECIES: N-6 DNA methylase [Methanospirillum]MDX8550230.1 N-6 DNA methylase [Methanospirillum hungatei]QVV90379.1 type I restriction-modification system subunit M [Methanospirillum sp. J.3.6.1-F.2.7.3]